MAKEYSVTKNGGQKMRAQAPASNAKDGGQRKTAQSPTAQRVQGNGSSVSKSGTPKYRTIEETMDLLGVGQKKDRYSFKAEQEERRAQQSMRQTVPETKTVQDAYKTAYTQYQNAYAKEKAYQRSMAGAPSDAAAEKHKQSYETAKKEREAAERQVKNYKKQLDIAGAETPDTSVWGRIKDTLSGTGLQRLGSDIGGLRTLYEAGQKTRTAEYEEQLAQYEKDLARAKSDYEAAVRQFGADGAQMEKNFVDDYQRKVDAYRKIVDENVQQRATQATSEMADELTAKGGEKLSDAKTGLGSAGRFAVDAGSGGANLLLDAALGRLGGPAITNAAMGFRAFGQTAQEAESYGADIDRQLGAGVASAAKAILTNKFSDGLAGLYGKGAADEVIEQAIGKLAKSDAGRNALRLFATSLGEGAEEVVDAKLDPLVSLIYDNGEALKQKYGSGWQGYKEAAADDLYAGLIGFALGMGGQAVSAARGDYARANAELTGGAKADENVTAEAASVQAAANSAANQMARRQTARTAAPVQENIPAADTADVMEQTAPVQSSAETGTQEAKPGARERAKIKRRREQRAKFQAETEFWDEQALYRMNRGYDAALPKELESTNFSNWVKKRTKAILKEGGGDYTVLPPWKSDSGFAEASSPDSVNEGNVARHADAATPGKTFNAVDALADYGKPAETAQARTETQGDNPAPAKAESVKQAGSDVLNSVLNLNSKNAQPKMTTEQIYNEYFVPKTQPKPADNGTKAQKNTASTEETKKTRLNMADYADNNSGVWNNLSYDDTAAQTKAMQDAHKRMMSEGRVVNIPESTLQKTAESFPDLRGMKKSERTPILKQKMTELKTDIRKFLNGLKNGSFEFEINGNILEAKLYDTGIKEVMEKVTQDKANMLSHSDQVFNNAEYLYSLPDYEGNPNVYRWNYFYTPVQIGDTTVGVRIAIRDMKQTESGRTESQIYNWGIKKAPTLDGGSPEKTSLSADVSSVGEIDASLDGARRLPSDGSIPGGVSSEASEASASTTSIPTTVQNVKGENTGNARGVFEPVYNRDAKPHTEEKLSKFWTNTLNETERAAGTPGEVSQPLSYMPKTEKQSLGEAASRLSADRQGEIERLVSAEAWSGVQVDAAASVAADLYREAKTTGNYEAYTAWRKVMQEHITSGGQGVQALAKYSRHSGENALSSIAEMIADSNLSPEQKKALINKVGDYAQRFDDITRGMPDNDASTAGSKSRKAPTKKLVSLIEDMARERGTWTFKDNVYSELLNKQNDAYLKEYAYRQILAMGNDSLTRASVADKAKSVQSMMQLTSIATFARNIGGNTTFGAVDTMTQDGFGVALDFLLSKATGKRTVGVDKGWFSSEARNGAVDAMQKSILEVAGDIDMEGEMNRYGQTSGRAFKMDSSPTDRFFSRWQQIMGYSLTTSDKFSRGAIEAEQLRGLGSIKDSGLTNEEMQALAKAMADYRLFQNQGTAYGISKAAHDYANVIGFGGEVEQGRRTGGFGLGDFINTYPGVPANLGVKVLEYSPANIVKGGAEMIDVIIKAKQGKVDVLKQQQAVMDVARGLAGVPAFALFAALTKAGFIRNWDDEDDADVKTQNAAEGKTGIQFNLDGALRYLNGDKSLEWRNGDRLDSIGWLEPINGFMAVGSLMANEPEAASKWAYVGDIAVGAVQAFLDIPVMSNISDIVDTFQYSKADTVLGKAGEAAAKYAGNMATSFMPSPVRGVAKGLDPYYRDTTGDTAAETAWNQFKLTVPGLRETLPVKQDNFGQPKMYSGNTTERLFDTLVNPGTRTKIRQSDASKVLEDLYKATGDADIYPDRKAPNSIDVDGEKETLTSAEKREYQRTAGGMSASLIESLTDNELYKTADNEEKTDILKELLSYSEDMAKKQWGDSKGKDIESNSWEKVFASQIPDVPDYVVSKQALQKAKTKPGKTDFDYLDKVLGNYRNLSPQSQELLSDSDLNVNKLLYADALGIGSKDYYAASKAVSDGEAKLGTSDVAKAISVYNNMKGKSDSEILSAIKAQVPPAKGGKQSSTVRRIEAYSKLAGDDADLGKWLELCASLSDADENSSVAKADVYTAWANMGLGPKDKYAGIDRNGFYNIVKSNNSLAANPDYATQIDEVYALLVPAEEKTKPKLTGTVQGDATGSKSVQHWSYEDIMESLGLAAKK